MSLNQMLPENVKNIQEYLRKNYADLLHSSGVLSEQIDEKLQEWQQQSHLQLLRQFPFELYENQLSEQQNHFQNKEIVFNEKHISEYKNFCQFTNVPFDGDFWHKQLNLKKQKGRESPKKLAWQLMLNQWQKQLDQAKAEWYLQKISELRQQFLKELEKWLDIIRQLSNQLDELGLDTGLLLDNSIGSLTPQDIEQFKRWSEYLKNDENAKKIAELMGRMRQIEQSEKIEQIQKTISVSVPNIDVNSREEIIGLRLGRELEYVLPSELALMADENTSILFDLKYMENKLMCFELQGIQFKDEEQKIIIEQKISEDEKLGPMILCVDTSGSMNGIPENIAKAMALYLANKAKSEKRDCFIVNFSMNIHTFEINQNTGIRDLIAFLKMSFHGGTDVAPALRHALNLMQTENYQKSDVLLISDFVMSSLPDDVLQSITIQRENSNKFNSLVIGDEFMSDRLKTHFDNEWIYNPHSKNIQELVQFQREVTNKNRAEK